jgi:hypothetical protein
MSRNTSTTSPVWVRALLCVGFLSLTAGLLAAYADPASTYELSLYAATPVLFWVCMALGTVVSLAVAFHRGLSPQLRTVGLVLAGGVFVAVLGIPIIRNYQFFGPADSLTHLGWIRDFQQNALSPFDILYPATHVMALVIAELGGAALTRAGQLTVVVYSVVYLLFVPLCVAYLSDHDWAIPFGLYAALLLLPINNVSVFRMMHPTTQGILFLPLVLYVIFRYLRAPAVTEWLPLSGTSWGVLLFVTSTSLLFIHPQQAANLVVVLVTIAGLQAIYGRVGDRIGSLDVEIDRAVYVPAAYVAAIFGLWIPQHQRATGPTQAIVEQAVKFVTESGESPVDGATRRAMSLSDIGGSIEELFVKLFLVTTVFFVATGLLMLLSYLGRIDWKDVRERVVIKHLTFSFTALTVIFLLYFLSSITTQHYRQLGLLAMLGSILGAVALSDLSNALSERFSSQSVAAVAAPVLIALLLMSAATAYRSPYMYQPSDQVPEMELTGYETALDHRSEDVAFTGISGGVGRFSDAIYGRNGSATQTIATAPEIPRRVFNRGNMTRYYDDPHYLVVTQRDYEREVLVYEGFKFSRQGFERLDRTPGVSKLVSNGDFRMYYVDPAEGAAATADGAAQEADAGAAGAAGENGTTTGAGDGKTNADDAATATDAPEDDPETPTDTPAPEAETPTDTPRNESATDAPEDDPETPTDTRTPTDTPVPETETSTDTSEIDTETATDTPQDDPETATGTAAA